MLLSWLKKIMHRLNGLSIRPSPENTSLVACMAENRQFAKQLSRQLTEHESRKQRGYQNSHKGMREGLSIAKQCIQDTDPQWVTVITDYNVDKDKLILLASIRQGLNGQSDSRFVIPPHVKTDIVAFINQHNAQVKSESVSSTTDEKSLCLTDVMSQKRRYINTISNGIKKQLCQQPLDDVQINSQLTQLIQAASHSYLERTTLTIIPDRPTFIWHVIGNIEKQKAAFNALPGDEGVYQLAGLASAAEWLKNESADLKYDKN